MSFDFPEREQLTDALFKKIAKYVYEHARINLTDKKRELVRSRLGKVIRQRGFAGYRSYYEYMTADNTGEALTEVMNAVSTNLTSFFRESKHFDFMKSKLIPDLVRRCNSTENRRIRGWSAGCSSGEEVYTISVVLHSSIERPDAFDIKLLATDIDTNMVNHGKRGVYDADRVKSIPPELRNKYFTKISNGGETSYQVKQMLRKLVSFRHLNLMGQWPFKGKFDFIFCRNVMIYFDKETQQTLIDRYYNALTPGGYLFIGHSEGLTGIRHNFKYAQPTIYCKG